MDAITAAAIAAWSTIVNTATRLLPPASRTNSARSTGSPSASTSSTASRTASCREQPRAWAVLPLIRGQHRAERCQERAGHPVAVARSSRGDRPAVRRRHCGRHRRGGPRHRRNARGGAARRARRPGRRPNGRGRRRTGPADRLSEFQRLARFAGDDFTRVRDGPARRAAAAGFTRVNYERLQIHQIRRRAPAPLRPAAAAGPGAGAAGRADRLRRPLRRPGGEKHAAGRAHDRVHRHLHRRPRFGSRPTRTAPS